MKKKHILSILLQFQTELIYLATVQFTVHSAICKMSRTVVTNYTVQSMPVLSIPETRLSKNTRNVFIVSVLFLTSHHSNILQSQATPNLNASFFILHSSSLITHPSSFILHPSSFILHPSSFIFHLSFFILQSLFLIIYSSSFNLHPSFFFPNFFFISNLSSSPPYLSKYVYALIIYHST